MTPRPVLVVLVLACLTACSGAGAGPATARPTSSDQPAPPLPSGHAAPAPAAALPPAVAALSTRRAFTLHVRPSTPYAVVVGEVDRVSALPGVSSATLVRRLELAVDLAAGATDDQARAVLAQLTPLGTVTARP